MSKLAARSFSKSSVTKIVLQTRKLTKKSQVKVGTAKENKKFVKKYKKVFKKKIVGAKVRVR